MASFSDQINDVEPKYLAHAVEYLAARGLTIQDVKLRYWVVAQRPWFTALKGNATEVYNPEGWAFDLGDGHYQMRVCNWPDKNVYHYEGEGEQRRRKQIDEPPKFISSTGCNNVVFTSPIEDIADSPLVMVHEKIVSAILCTKISGYPSIAILGCQSWRTGGKMSADFKRAMLAMRQGAKLAICFDRDVENPRKNIGASAAALKYEMSKLRPDIEVVVFRVPTGGATAGFDDWMVGMDEGQRAVALNALLQGEGLNLRMPAEFWIETYHLGSFIKNKEIVVESNQDTYERLFRGVMPWADIYKDICGGYYYSSGARAYSSIDTLCSAFTTWLYEHIWKNTNTKVSKEELRTAIRTILETKTISVALKRIEQWPEVSDEEADEAAELLITKGLEVYGPNDKERTKEIIKRVARDMCYLWEPGAPHSHIQWVLALIGPQGCGKSSFLTNFCGALATDDFAVSVSPVPLKEDDAIRACRDNLIGIFDDWHNLDRADAKKSENIIFKLSTMSQSVKINIKYKEDFEHAPRHAALVLTTTDNNTQFLHSSSGAGERRFICLQVRGVVEGVSMGNGKRLMEADHSVVAHCGKILLRYGLQLARAGSTAPANEWSLDTIKEFQADEWAYDDMAEYGNGNPEHREKAVRDILTKWKDIDGRPCMLLDQMIIACRGNTSGKISQALRASYLRVFQDCGMEYTGEQAVKIEGLGPRRRVLRLKKSEVESFIAKLLRY